MAISHLQNKDQTDSANKSGHNENVEPPELGSSDESWIEMIEKMSFETESFANQKMDAH